MSTQGEAAPMNNVIYKPYIDWTEKLAMTCLDNLSLTKHLEPAAMSLSALEEHSMREFNNFWRGSAYNDRYCLEILRRATLQGDNRAWECLQRCFSGILRGWIHRHPSKEAAYRFDSEENYMAQAFERFWLATSRHEKLEFDSLSAALRYLHACLNGAILDTLRVYSRLKEVPLPGPDEAGELLVEDSDEVGEVWEAIRGLLPDEREQRAAYLLYHCGLKPREIVSFCPQEFSEVREVYRLRRNIVHRLLRNADSIRWRLK
jgi:DNA-directed RNA polymerase specialized sigma24 family protein